MPLINSIIKAYLLKRLARINHAAENPHHVQKITLKYLIHLAKNTEWGREYNFQKIRTEKEYKKKVPIQTYDSLKPYIFRTFNGEQNILWPTHIKWFAKSSGTTEDRSKYIPVSRQSLRNCNYRAGKDILTMYVKNHPETEIFDGKCLLLSGSVQQNPDNPKAYAGDISGVLVKNLQFWIHHFRTPSRQVAMIPNWEEKIAKILAETRNQDVRYLSGVPSWMLVILNQMLQETGKSDLRDIWPNLELFIHGAVNFNPYREQFLQKIPHKDMYYFETYNASEGFFAMQDITHAEDMLLMTDYGIYFEFMPLEELGAEEPRTLTLREVEEGKNYAVVISTNAGLWRYLIGDTIKFTSLKPFRIQVTGRTKHFINAFGEELVVENAEKALAFACKETDALMTDYTAAPVYISDADAGSHEWLIEFEKLPEDIEKFTDILDEKLQELNSDYEAKRLGNLTLKRPIVRPLPLLTFYNWMKKRGQLGAQNKVPRLSNDRKYVDEIIREAGLSV